MGVELKQLFSSPAAYDRGPAAKFHRNVIQNLHLFVNYRAIRDHLHILPATGASCFGPITLALGIDETFQAGQVGVLAGQGIFPLGLPEHLAEAFHHAVLDLVRLGIFLDK